jgi:hypothetical protein
MLMLLLVLANGAGQPDLPDLPNLPRQWAQFSRAGALSHVSETVDIATGDTAGSRTFRYTLRFTRRRGDGKPEISWADSATCPAIQAVIADMPNIKMPSPAPYGLPDQPLTITVDGTLYALSAPSSDNMGRLSISSNIGSPLAAWIDSAFPKLEPCWQATAP